MQETVFTAARRALRFFNIVMQHGGLVDREFEQAMSTLQKEVEKEQKKNEDSRNRERS